MRPNPDNDNLDGFASDLLFRPGELEGDRSGSATAAGIRGVDESRRGLQRYLEASGVNPFDLMNHLVALSQAYGAVWCLVKSQDELIGQTLASLGRL
jgi:flagellar basal body rod protein FlgG